MEKENMQDKINIYIFIASSFSQDPMILDLLLNRFMVDIMHYNLYLNCLNCASSFDNNVEMIKYLIDKIIIIIIPQIIYNYILYCAISQRNYEVIKYLMDHHIKNNKNELWITFSDTQGSLFELQEKIVYLINITKSEYLYHDLGFEDFKAMLNIML